MNQKNKLKEKVEDLEKAERSLKIYKEVSDKLNERDEAIKVEEGASKEYATAQAQHPNLHDIEYLEYIQHKSQHTKGFPVDFVKNMNAQIGSKCDRDSPSFVVPCVLQNSLKHENIRREQNAKKSLDEATAAKAKAEEEFKASISKLPTSFVSKEELVGEISTLTEEVDNLREESHNLRLEQECVGENRNGYDNNEEGFIPG